MPLSNTVEGVNKELLDIMFWEEDIESILPLSWNSRMVHGETGFEIADIIDSAKDYLRRFEEVQLQFHTPRPPKGNREWVPPVVDFVKFNVDVAIDKHRRMTQVCVVGRDCSGVVLFCPKKGSLGIMDVEIAEGIAAAGVQMAMDKGWRNVIVEGDCLRVIKALKTNC